MELMLPWIVEARANKASDWMSASLAETTVRQRLTDSGTDVVTAFVFARILKLVTTSENQHHL